MTRQKLRIVGMHCTSCAMAIDIDLEELPGVKEAKTSFARSTTEVVFDPAKVALETIVRTIAELSPPSHHYTPHPKPSTSQ